MGRTIGLILALQDKCSPNIKKIADNLGITEKEAKKLNAQIGKLSKDLGGKLKGACVAVGAGLSAVVATAGVLVNKTMEAGDRIDKMSQRIGLSRENFQKWDYILSQSGTDVEKMQVGMKTMSQQMVASTKKGSEAQKMFQRLGVTVKDSNGKFKSQEQAFEEIIRAFQKMPDGIEKANMAQKLFGKTGSELRPLLNGVRGNIDELEKKFNDLGMLMSDDAVNASVKLKDTIDTVQRAFSAFGNQIGAELVPTIQQLADELISHLPQIKSALTPVLQGLTNTVKFLIEHFRGLAVIGSMVVGTFVAFNIINGVITTIKTLQTVIKAVSLAQGIWNALMLANPIGLIAVGIGVLIGAITALIMNWDKLKNAFVSVMEKHLILKDIAKLVQFAFNISPIGIFINAIKAVVQNWDKIKQAFMAFYEKIQPALSFIGNLIRIAFNLTPLMLFINGLKLLDENWEKIHNTIKKAIEAVKNFLKIKGNNKVEVETKDGTKVKKNAVGTSYFSGGQTRINEFGGEIVDLPQGTRIIPNDISQQIAKNNGGGIVVNVTIAGNMIGNQEFLNQLTDAFARKLQVAMAVK